ncbi:DegT/DnrJ/EryC1/StrS family aminotransferase [Sphingomonas sp. CBMAI 2297]|uniref:DegT/DnrJ/EryC1/StrS family aminotransferase n=1 Tax=Sphingomonas sp. CBMAI 2297 TaxID=2991720 RepID=UPI002455F32E|nr:DegT/DnrJ/EryC1/StrS family aminotransferase [Sphingomonas sp. CBMAI 2297]MDH4742988.1 DegT/DnrJ/EryC1/StrS family aminotransferase [Sphingomonas sp. CBMAI 2297]
MTVPFLDLKAATAELSEPIHAAVRRVVDSGWYILGPEVEAFEAEFAAYCGAEHCVGVANGLDALKLSLLVFGVRPGDEVIVPSNTFIATNLAVSQIGAIPIPVEPDEATCNIDPARIEAKISPRTKAILPVHLYGLPADLDSVHEVAARHGIPVIEDAAQAHGARYKGKRIGAHSRAVAWSFYPGKNLGGLGDAGAITTSDKEVADRLRMLRNYGSSVKYRNDLVGYNSRLDPIQAAVLRVKLDHLEEWNGRRQAIAASYRARLAGSGLTLPAETNWGESSWHLFVVRHAQRDWLVRALAERGVEALIHYPVPPHKQQAYAGEAWTFEEQPIASRMADEVLSLPIGPQLSAAQAESVIEAVNAALAEDPAQRR